MKHLTRSFSVLAIVLCLLVTFQPAQASPALDGGWDFDQILQANANSVASPYNINLVNPTFFRITDAFIPGDQYIVRDFGVPILTTALGSPAVRVAFGDDQTADAAWVSNDYQHGEVLLAPGQHQLTVQGNGAGGLPAAFYTRLDTDRRIVTEPGILVPEPGTFLLFGLGTAALTSYGWRRRQRGTV